jgi:hypothetical protein
VENTPSNPQKVLFFSIMWYKYNEEEIGTNPPIKFIITLQGDSMSLLGSIAKGLGEFAAVAAEEIGKEVSGLNALRRAKGNIETMEAKSARGHTIPEELKKKLEEFNAECSKYGIW